MDKDLVIADPRVSRDHALLISENGKVFVQDQGSKHGTFVNGERVERKQLEPRIDPPRPRLRWTSRSRPRNLFCS